MMKVKTTKRYEELLTKIKNVIKSKTNNSDDKKYTKIKLNSDNDLTLWYDNSL